MRNEARGVSTHSGDVDRDVYGAVRCKLDKGQAVKHDYGYLCHPARREQTIVSSRAVYTVALAVCLRCPNDFAETQTTDTDGDAS